MGRSTFSGFKSVLMRFKRCMSALPQKFQSWCVRCQVARRHVLEKIQLQHVIWSGQLEREEVEGNTHASDSKRWHPKSRITDNHIISPHTELMISIKKLSALPPRIDIYEAASKMMRNPIIDRRENRERFKVVPIWFQVRYIRRRSLSFSLHMHTCARM